MATLVIRMSRLKQIAVQLGGKEDTPARQLAKIDRAGQRGRSESHLRAASVLEEECRGSRRIH